VRIRERVGDHGQPLRGDLFVVVDHADQIAAGCLDGGVEGLGLSTPPLLEQRDHPWVRHLKPAHDVT